MVVTQPKRAQWAQEAHINWELNERISLSSAGSRGSRPASPPRGTPVQRRWTAAQDRLERTNEVLSRRLTVIEELNRKILANRERLQEPARRPRWRPREPRRVPEDRCTLQRERAPSWAEEEPEEEEAQERSVLRQLNEAIDRFEEEHAEDAPGNTSKGSGHDSSWDSGVGAELAAQGAARTTGWLRVHTGLESSLLYLTLETTAADVCRDMLLSDSLALYVQVTNCAAHAFYPRRKF